MNRALAICAALTALVASGGADAARRRAVSYAPLPELISGSIIAPPHAVVADGIPHLAWEIVLTNGRSENVTIERIDLVSASGTLATYSDAAVRERLLNLPLRATASNVMRGGESAIVYFLLTAEEVPPFINHVIEVSSSRGRETLYEPFTAVRTNPPIVFSAPLRGRSWFAANGLHNDSGHRRTAVLIGGRLTVPQRYAIDWIQIDERGSTFAGDVRLNSSFYAYGNELMAVADGVVIATQDGIPENVPRQTPVIPITLDTAAGNFVIVDAGEGHYVLYAHLQPGSLRVKRGDAVTRGMVLGLLGNSGNSTEPHLHFHVCDAGAALACDGVPYVFDHFSTASGQKRLELPANNAIVDFENE